MTETLPARTGGVQPARSAGLARDTTLPSLYFLDQSVHQREKERIFGRTWLVREFLGQ